MLIKYTKYTRPPGDRNHGVTDHGLLSWVMSRTDTNSFPPFFVQSGIYHTFPPSGQGYFLPVFTAILDCLEREHQTIANLVSCPFICLHVPVYLVSLFYCQSVRAVFRPSLFHSCDFEPWLKFTISSQYLEFLPRLMDFKAVRMSWSLLVKESHFLYSQ